MLRQIEANEIIYIHVYNIYVKGYITRKKSMKNNSHSVLTNTDEYSHCILCQHNFAFDRGGFQIYCLRFWA